jgi:serine/threonine-protein kinase
MVKAFNLEVDTVIRGKWYGKEFKVLGPLGRGGTASIFLVKEISTGKRFALKISKDMVNIEEEYEVLSRLNGFDYVPSVYYRDDCILDNTLYFFLVISYFRGKNLAEVCREGNLPLKTVLQVVMIACNICNELNALNIYYCDLKPENLMFDVNTCCLYLIDFGGTAGKGESIAHFTPCFDRASWGKGERTADENYQIFGLSMLLILLLLNRQIDRDKDYSKLLNLVQNSHLSKKLKKVIIEGLEQKYNGLQEFNRGLEEVLIEAVSERECKNKKIGLVIDFIFFLSLTFLTLVIVALIY